MFVVGLCLLSLIWPGPAKAAGSDYGADHKSCIPLNGLIVLTEFPDVAHRVSANFARKRFFKRLNKYVQEMSYGKYCVGGKVTDKWYKLPHSVNKYRISPRNLEVDKSRIRNLIGDLLDAADKDVDFSRYDFVAIFLGAQRTDYGMIGLCGYPGMLGWSSRDQLKTPSGEVIKGGVAIFSYQAHLGTLFHDIGHILGGVEQGKRVLPCLYDHDLQAKPGPIREVFVDATINMGLWDPMSCHYYKRKQPPPGLSAWSKLRLGWIDPSKVTTVKAGETRKVVLGPLEEGSASTLAIRLPLSDSTYYLIENRQPLGFDRYLPGHGVLIMYADDDVAECRHGRAPVRLVDADPGVEHLEGAAFDLGKNAAFVDRKNGVRIKLLRRIGKSYQIEIQR